MEVRLPVYKTKSFGEKLVCVTFQTTLNQCAVDNSNLQGKSKNIHELKEL